MKTCKHLNTAEFCSLCRTQTEEQPAATTPNTLGQSSLTQSQMNGPVTWHCSTVVDDEEVAAISAGLSYISHLESKLRADQMRRVWQFLSARMGE